MKIGLLVHECRRRGVVLDVEAGSIRMRGPQGSLNPEFVECIRRHKAELIGFLTIPSADRDLDHTGRDLDHNSPQSRPPVPESGLGEWSKGGAQKEGGRAVNPGFTPSPSTSRPLRPVFREERNLHTGDFSTPKVEDVADSVGETVCGESFKGSSAPVSPDSGLSGLSGLSTAKPISKPVQHSPWHTVASRPALDGFARDCGRALVRQASAWRVALESDGPALVADPPPDLPADIWDGLIEGFVAYAPEVIAALAEPQTTRVVRVEFTDGPGPDAYRRPAELSTWPIAKRQRWADRTAVLEDSGLGWCEAEEQAYEDVRAGLDLADHSVDADGKVPPLADHVADARNVISPAAEPRMS